MYHWLFTLSFLTAVLLADFTTAAVRWDELRVKHTFSGTSCSTPVHLNLNLLTLPRSKFIRLTANVQTVAGIISLPNDYLLSEDEDPLGWLNPWLYGDSLTPAAFNDITSGSKPSCKTAGFSALVGWDPVTGLGTLDFDTLQKTLAKRIKDRVLKVGNNTVFN